jgi:CheY-like chemotaxis protein
MSRIVLIHWHEGEAKERAKTLRRAGHRVVCHSRSGGQELRPFKKRPPDAFVIDLGRLPSQGSAVATWLRQQSATRKAPILFIEGAVDKTRRVKDLLPDAVYTTWDRIGRDLVRALDQPPRAPFVPGTMDGYVGVPLPKKLGIRAHQVLAVLGGPVDFEHRLGALPEGVTLRKQARGTVDVIVLFVKTKADLARRLPAALRALTAGGKLWLAWPKQASGQKSDLTQKEVRAIGLASGLVDFKICAIDATWSGLCFTRRRVPRV